MIRFSTVILLMAVICSASLAAKAQTSPGAPATPSTPDSVSETGTLTGSTGNTSIFYYDVPFRPMALHGGPLIRIRLNDKLTITSLFDTGTNSSYLRPETITELGLKVQKLERPNLDGGKPVSADGVILDKFEIGSYIHFSPAYLLVNSNATDIFNEADPTVSGICSADYFVPYSVLFDFETQTLSVIPTSNFTTAQLTALGIPEGTPAIPMTTAGDPKLPEFSVKMRVKGEGDTYLEDSFVLDTGNERTLIVGDPKRLKITPLMTMPRIDIEGKSYNSVCVVKALQIVDPQHPSSIVPLSHVECQFGENPKKKNVRISNLGMDVLSHFRVLMDFPARKIYFAPLLHGNDLMYPTETARVCGERLIYDAVFKPSATGQWSVDTLRPVLQGRGYFEAKGVHQGDVILSIQGMKTDGLLPDELQRQIVKYTDKLTLTVLRDGKAVNLQ